MIIKGLGVQLESQKMSGGVAKRFIDIHRVRDVVINEVSTRSYTKVIHEGVYQFPKL